MTSIHPHPKGNSGDPRATTGLRNFALILAGLGFLLSLAVISGPGLRRFAFGYLWVFLFLWTLVLGGLFFVGLHHVTGAVWSVLVRRVAEMFAAPVIPLALLFLPLGLFLFLGDPGGLYPWVEAGPESTLAGKSAYLNRPFFLVRSLLFFVIWFLYARFFVGRSLRTDKNLDQGVEQGVLRRGSTHFMVAFAFTISFAAIDWVMSLEPHWFSTIYGVYIFSGMAVTALAAVTLVTLWLRARGGYGLDAVGPDHLYSLGVLQFSFVCFWGYIAFSQYMLIWYANLPEETVFFAHRLDHGWLAITLALALVRFVLPFLLLLSRWAKTNPTTLVGASLLAIVGQLLDLYWLVMPQFSPQAPVFGWPELGPLCLLVGLTVFWFSHFLGRHPMVPAGDPDFQRSRSYHL